MTPASSQLGGQLSDMDSIATDSAASTPRADRYDPSSTRLRFMCSFGGKILPRPHDNQLRYVGGDTRIVAFSRHTTYSAFLAKLSKIVGTCDVLSVKYQLPNEDLDALISVSNDEDIENMMDEYERIGSKTARLRLFLFDVDSGSRTSSISSLLDGSSRRESWFLDALNGGRSVGSVRALERGQSEASSIVSEVPDYLFGLDNADEPVAVAHQLREPKVRTRSNLADCVSGSDPGSPAPVMSPFCSSSSATVVPQMVPNLPPVKIKVDSPGPVIQPNTERQQVEANVDPPAPIPDGLVQSNPMWQYNLDPHYPGQAVQSVQTMPVYYIPGPAQPGNYPVQHLRMQPQFIQQFQQPPTGQQLPVGYQQPGIGMGQIYNGPGNGGMIRPVTMGLESFDVQGRLQVPEGSNQPAPFYYGAVPMYPGQGMVLAASMGMDERIGSGSEAKSNGVVQ